MAEEEGKTQEFEQQLESAMCARLQHFSDQADVLTMESVRRLLEKDLGLEKFALDVHKRLIRLYLLKKMDGADDCTSEITIKNAEKDVPSEEAKIMPKQHETKIDKKKSSSGDDEIMEDSPIMGVLTPKAEVGTQGSSLSDEYERFADEFDADDDTEFVPGTPDDQSGSNQAILNAIRELRKEMNEKFDALNMRLEVWTRGSSLSDEYERFADEFDVDDDTEFVPGTPDDQSGSNQAILNAIRVLRKEMNEKFDALNMRLDDWDRRHPPPPSGV